MKLLRPKTKEEWLEIRKGFISSTESSALLGMNPYHTAFEIAVAKRDGLDIGTATERTVWGQRLQDSIADGVACDYGLRLEGMDLSYAHKDDTRMGSSFDYKIVAASGQGLSELAEVLAGLSQQHGAGLLEVKNVDSLQFKKEWYETDFGYEAPEHIEIQLQHQLEVLELEFGVIAALIGGNRTHLIIRQRDREVGRGIASTINRFWANFEKGILPPPVMPEDAEMIIRLYQYAEPDKVFDASKDEVLKASLEQHFKFGEMERHYKKLREEAKALIFQAIGNAERVVGTDYNVSAAMRAPVEIAAHTRAGYRDFRITKRKEKK